MADDDLLKLFQREFAPRTAVPFLPQCLTWPGRIMSLAMWDWIVQNKQWVFSGAGVTALGVLWWLVTKLRRREPAPAITTTQAPNTNIAPSIVMNPTINLGLEQPKAEPPKVIAPPAPPATPMRPNLCIEAVKIGKISLEGDIWRVRPTSESRIRPNRALFADISNVPTDETHTARAAIRAAIRMDFGGRPRTYSPLPWLDEFTNTAYLEVGARKTVVLAVGEDSKTGTWNFVLNHRKDHYTSNRVSEMDWTNACPVPFNLPFETLMIDVNTGALLSKFVYLWTFDAENNWPILKTVD